MTNVRFLEFVFLFGIYCRVQTYDVQVTNLTIKVQSLKLNQVKYEYSLFKKNHDYKLNFGPNIQSDKLDLPMFFQIPSIRRKTRQLHDTLHSIVSSTRPILGRITSSLPLYLKGTLNIVIPSSPNSYVPLKDLHLLHSNKNNKMYKSMSNNLLLQNRKVKFHQITTPSYSTVHSGLTKLLDESVTLTTVRNTIDRSQIRNNTMNEKSSYQENQDLLLFDNFSKSLEQFERLLYQVTFKKLLSISPAGHQENGISFIQSALFLYLALMAISTEVDRSTKVEIENCLNYEGSKMNKMKILRHSISWLPNSNRNMKFRWTSRLVLNSELPVSHEFVEDTATVRLHVTRLNDTKPEVISNTLNRMIEIDSGGALRNTFEEDDMLNEICSILFTTMYIRPRWRVAPTVLNGTRVFYDTSEAPKRSVRMIRINDVMKYAALDEWNSDAIEISYGIPNLTLLLLIPRGHSLKSLAKIMTNTNIRDISTMMRTMRVAATLPIYTLRMTLLLPEKLKTMGISRLVEADNSSRCNEIRLSHAVQRLMFWAEAGRNAFKDDGIEWDETPDLEFVVNRPYLFYVRWKNVTLINGTDHDKHILYGLIINIARHLVNNKHCMHWLEEETEKSGNSFFLCDIIASGNPDPGNKSVMKLKTLFVLKCLFKIYRFDYMNLLNLA